LRKFARLYAIEKQIKALSTEQRYVIRQEKSKPLMLELKQWCEADKNAVGHKRAPATQRTLTSSLIVLRVIDRYLSV
jgi:hypothetical protein